MGMKVRTARKGHVCSLCQYRIPKGTLHHSGTLTPWDHEDNDRFINVHIHTDCMHGATEWWGDGDTGFLIDAPTPEWLDDEIRFDGLPDPGIHTDAINEAGDGLVAWYNRVTA